VAELVRRLHGHSAALALPLSWLEQRWPRPPDAEQLVQLEAQHQAAEQVSVSNSIGSLRLLAATDWREFVETLSTWSARCAATRPACMPAWTSPPATPTATRSSASRATARPARRGGRGRARAGRRAGRAAPPDDRARRTSATTCRRRPAATERGSACAGARQRLRRAWRAIRCLVRGSIVSPARAAAAAAVVGRRRFRAWLRVAAGGWLSRRGARAGARASQLAVAW
jgi:hypothetical protein